MYCDRPGKFVWRPLLTPFFTDEYPEIFAETDVNKNEY